MPAGFQSDPSPPGEPETFFCNDRRSRIPQRAEALTDYYKPNFGPYIAETLRSYTSAAQAAAALEHTRRAASSCHTFTTSDGIRHTIGQLGFRRYGYAMLAVSLREHVVGSPDTESDIIYVQFGTVLLEIVERGVAADPDLTDQMVRKALTGLYAVAPAAFG